MIMRRTVRGDWVQALPRTVEARQEVGGGDALLFDVLVDLALGSNDRRLNRRCRRHQPVCLGATRDDTVYIYICLAGGLRAPSCQSEPRCTRRGARAWSCRRA